MAVTEKIIYYSQIQRMRHPHQAGPRREALGWPRQRELGELRQNLSCGFLGRSTRPGSRLNGFRAGEFE